MIRAILIGAALALPLAAHAQAPAAAPQAVAPAPATAGFLVIDGERLATEAAAMRSIFDQMAARRDTEAAAYNLALDKLDNEFEPVRSARSTMDAAEYQKAVDQYNGIRAQIDGTLAKVQDDMNKAGEKAVEQFNSIATLVGQQVRQDYGVSRFLDSSSVLYIRPGSPYDVTDEVIRRVDAKLPDIKVDFPERPKPAPATPAAETQ
ncbi:OmpH family outer membrane protein [Emcibacter sp. SYSU 3D8]|uniref:OmpH family outer membrane protein n=1 Tax=Emcibacter sp. SYSU 3D8 TaxID=3133969 RepID=UPI0031FE8724